MSARAKILERIASLLNSNGFERPKKPLNYAVPITVCRPLEKKPILLIGFLSICTLRPKKTLGIARFHHQAAHLRAKMNTLDRSQHPKDLDANINCRPPRLLQCNKHYHTPKRCAISFAKK